MDTVTATFAIADWMAKGLADGTFERVGGVIRAVDTKQVVAWLREAGSIASKMPALPADPVTGVLNLIVSGVNTGVSVKGFADVDKRLDGIGQSLQQVQGVLRTLPADPVTGVLNLIVSGVNTGVSLKGFADVNKGLDGIGQSLQQVQGVLQITTAASVLNLGVSVMGFAVINQRLNELEQRLQKAEELLNKINRKIDLGFYANFHAAINLAINAFTMNKPEKREASAMLAINRFLEAQHIYTDFTDKELEQKSQIADEYLLTLSLAYLAEARCYLELGEHETALRRFQEGAVVLRERTQKYVDLLLTSNPAIYLQPQFKGQINLSRLTRIYQWTDPTLDENAVFEMQRENIVRLVQDPNQWVDSLPSAIWDAKVDWVGKAFWDDQKPQIYARLPKTLEVIESMVETNRRFEAYQAEVQAIAQLGITFQEWLKLAPSDQAQPDGVELMYIIPNKPLELMLSM